MEKIKFISGCLLPAIILSCVKGVFNKWESKHEEETCARRTPRTQQPWISPTWNTSRHHISSAHINSLQSLLPSQPLHKTDLVSWLLCILHLWAQMVQKCFDASRDAAYFRKICKCFYCEGQSKSSERYCSLYSIAVYSSQKVVFFCTTQVLAVE